MDSLTQNVKAQLTGGQPGTIPTITSSLRYDDMNVSTGGIAREASIGTAYTNVYSYTGSGLLFGFLLTLEDEKKWDIQLIVDGATIFTIRTSDLDNGNLYGYPYNAPEQPVQLGISTTDKTFRWNAPLGFPMIYNSTVVVRAKHIDSTKRFRAGLICLTK